MNKISFVLTKLLVHSIEVSTDKVYTLYLYLNIPQLVYNKFGHSPTDHRMTLAASSKLGYFLLW